MSASIAQHDLTADSIGGALVKVLTVRNVDEELDAALRGASQRRGISLNALALDLLRTGLALTPSRSPSHDLDRFAATWSQEEATEFDRVIEEMFEQVDEEQWK
jgi:plasmid stability protein